jgi:hypothetical protein
MNELDADTVLRPFTSINAAKTAKALEESSLSWDAVANTSVHETQKRLSGRAFRCTWRTWTRAILMDTQYSHSSRQSCQPKKHETNATKQQQFLVTAPSATATTASTEENRQLVVIAKHLCGAGTDLALKSLEPINQVSACVMATCCHGACTWDDYVGRDYLCQTMKSKAQGDHPSLSIGAC